MISSYLGPYFCLKVFFIRIKLIKFHQEGSFIYLFIFLSFVFLSFVVVVVVVAISWAAPAAYGGSQARG